MHVITLTSDLGSRDHYVAALKARALQLLPEVSLVDITHHIPAFDVLRAAFVLKNVWRDFPQGTVHIVAVANEWKQDQPFMLLQKDGHYFLSSDNGFFSLLLDGAAADALCSLHLQGDEEINFPAKSVFLPAAARLLRGSQLHELGTPAERYLMRQSLQPVVSGSLIRGAVIYTDVYGNVITNITRALFESVIGEHPFRIILRRGDDDLRSISRVYGEVPEGEKVALFTGGGYLEIAINKGVEGSGGGASGLLGLRPGDVVRVEIEE